MGEKVENEITVNSKEDVSFHLPAEREKVKSGANLLIEEVVKLEEALQGGDAASIAAVNQSVQEFIENLNNASKNIQTLVAFVADMK